MKKSISTENLAYIAGFLDGDGCILAQIVAGQQYKYRFTVRVSIVFYQKAKRRWLLIWFKEQFDRGWIRIKKDGMAEYAITGFSDVRLSLLLLLPFLRLKKPVAILILKIIELWGSVHTEADFIEVCQLVDKVAEHTDSKRRFITTSVVQKTLILPVET